MAKGAFVLVLHGHLPWVLHHGRWPHGEDWLFEAAAETWMPLLQVIERATNEGIRVAWTVGMMPILLEQLAHETFRSGFVRYLEEARDQAEVDERDFNAWGDNHTAWLAAEERVRHELMIAQFEAMDRDLIAAMRAHASAGRLEILSSNATHAFHPLLLHDACARAQIRAGMATTERHFGRRAKGVWLPECAYRPQGMWTPPTVHGDPRDRMGVARLFSDEGVRHFFVEHHLITTATPVAAFDGARVVDTSPHGGDGRAWRSTFEAHRVVEGGVPTDVTVMGRAMDIAENVWNAEVGYPGDGRYREFHKRHGMRGLRYWKVTGRNVDLGGKDGYRPQDAHEAVFTHADHFARLVREGIAGHHEGTGGRYGVVCAPFDAELFGHWWFEGPEFLLEVARRLHHDPDVDLLTASEYLERVPPDKGAQMPEGTWGDGGDHRVWLNEGTRAYWDFEYRAEDRFLHLWHTVPWRTDELVRELLTEAARQLLLLQASDWPFVITTEGAPDYGWRRITGHAGRFDDLCLGVEDVSAGRAMPVQAEAALAYCRKVDAVFADLDLAWWTA